MKVAQNKRFRFGHLRCRSPHGERGLKLDGVPGVAGLGRQSLPARGAWIEMALAASNNKAAKVAPRTGSVD